MIMNTKARTPETGHEDLGAAARYTKILVPLDGSPLAERVLPYVAVLARGFGASVELLNVFNPASKGLADPAPGHPQIEMREALPYVSILPPRGHADPAHRVYSYQIDASVRDRALDYLHHVTPSIGCAGIEVSSTVEAGDPDSWIVSVAEKEPGTLIAMSTHGRSGAARLILGSITNKVLHSTNAPVLVLRPRDGEAPAPEAELKHVIVPLDGSPLAEQVLPHVVSLAQALGLTVTLLRVPSHHQSGPPVNYLAKIGEKLERAGLPSVKSRIIGGHPAETIVSVARETPHSMVAMTTHGRSGIKRWVLGSVTDHVVRHCGEPVLVIRAADKAGEWEK